MPSVRVLTTILKNAGLTQSEIVHAQIGRRAENSRGFRVQASPIDRRVAHVYHNGKGARVSLDSYAAALRASGYEVERAHGGLKVTSQRKLSDRGKAHSKTDGQSEAR